MRQVSGGGGESSHWIPVLQDNTGAQAGAGTQDSRWARLLQESGSSSYAARSPAGSAVTTGGAAATDLFGGLY